MLIKYNNNIEIPKEIMLQGMVPHLDIKGLFSLRRVSKSYFEAWGSFETLMKNLCTRQVFTPIEKTLNPAINFVSFVGKLDCLNKRKSEIRRIEEGASGGQIGGSILTWENVHELRSFEYERDIQMFDQALSGELKEVINFFKSISLSREIPSFSIPMTKGVLIHGICLKMWENLNRNVLLIMSIIGIVYHHDSTLNAMLAPYCTKVVEVLKVIFVLAASAYGLSGPVKGSLILALKLGIQIIKLISRICLKMWEYRNMLLIMSIIVTVSHYEPTLNAMLAPYYTRVMEALEPLLWKATLYYHDISDIAVESFDSALSQAGVDQIIIAVSPYFASVKNVLEHYAPQPDWQKITRF